MDKTCKILSVIFLSLVLFAATTCYYCYYHYQFWTFVDTSPFEYLTGYSSDHIDGFRGRQILVHKKFIPYMEKMEKYAACNNVELIVNHSYRALNQKIHGTIAKPANNSNHHAGFAIDLNIRYGNKIYTSSTANRKRFKHLPRAIQQFLQLVHDNPAIRWGGDFYHADPVHFDVPLNRQKRALYKTYYQQCAADYCKARKKWRLWFSKISLGFF